MNRSLGVRFTNSISNSYAVASSTLSIHRGTLNRPIFVIFTLIPLAYRRNNYSIPIYRGHSTPPLANPYINYIGYINSVELGYAQLQTKPEVWSLPQQTLVAQSRQGAGFKFGAQGAAAGAVITFAKQGIGVIGDESLRHIDQAADGQGQYLRFANAQTLGDKRDVGGDGFEAFGAGGEIDALLHTFGRKPPAHKSAPPGQAFPQVNTGVGAVVDAQEQDPTILIHEGIERGKGFL